MIFNWWAGVKYVAGGQCEYTPTQPRTRADTCAYTSWCSSCVSVRSFPDWSHQLPGPCSDVSVLRPGSFWPEHVQVPLVETLPHLPAAGQYFCLCKLASLSLLGLFKYVSNNLGWRMFEKALSALTLTSLPWGLALRETIVPTSRGRNWMD